jgi:uncharacterized tellurite resistance protein B-like protein
MLDLFSKILGKESEGAEAAGDGEGVAVATAVFLLEIAHADSQVHHLEEAAVRDGLKAIFGKSSKEVETILEKAHKARDESFDLYQFSREINGYFENEKKNLILENIWRVVYADGTLDKYEEALVRKIAKLMRLSHREMIQAKLKVLNQREGSLPDEPDA